MCRALNIREIQKFTDNSDHPDGTDNLSLPGRDNVLEKRRTTLYITKGNQDKNL